MYFVTSPRFLNYKFSPASWWFLYSVDHEFSAMIAEVNNTFDERRMYFLAGSEKAEPHSDQEPPKDADGVLEAPSQESIARSKAKFTKSFAKDFHVSPFSSRKGGYKVESRNPLALASDNYVDGPDGSQQCMRGAIDLTATLSSSKGRAKLVARLYSTSAPIDPFYMSTTAKIRFILSWWWVGLVTCQWRFKPLLRSLGY